MPASSNENELDMLVGRMKAAAAPIREVLREIHARYAANDEGKVADYIPELVQLATRATPTGLAPCRRVDTTVAPDLDGLTEWLNGVWRGNPR